MYHDKNYKNTVQIYKQTQMKNAKFSKHKQFSVFGWLSASILKYLLKSSHKICSSRGTLDEQMFNVFITSVGVQNDNCLICF